MSIYRKEYKEKNIAIRPEVSLENFYDYYHDAMKHYLIHYWYIPSFLLKKKAFWHAFYECSKIVQK